MTETCERCDRELERHARGGSLWCPFCIVMELIGTPAVAETPFNLPYTVAPPADAWWPHHLDDQPEAIGPYD